MLEKMSIKHPIDCFGETGRGKNKFKISRKKNEERKLSPCRGGGGGGTH